MFAMVSNISEEYRMPIAHASPLVAPISREKETDDGAGANNRPERRHNAFGSVSPAMTDYYSTREAAKILSVGSTTIQYMVERGELEAWKTQGGHRRILRKSVDEMKARRETGVAQARPLRSQEGQFTVVVVEDDADLLKTMVMTLNSWRLPMRVLSATNGLEALLIIERERPDMLLTDLAMDKLDGFDLMRLLRSRGEFNAMEIVVFTGLEDAEIQRRGGVPKGIVVCRKPVPLDTLRIMLQAGVSRKEMDRAGA